MAVPAWVVVVVGAIAVAALAAVAWRLLRRPCVQMISAAELRARMEAAQHPALIDLRDWRDVLKSGGKLPGAVVLRAADVPREVKAGALAGELVLYCG
jgi:hypothetical protein